MELTYTRDARLSTKTRVLLEVNRRVQRINILQNLSDSTEFKTVYLHQPDVDVLNNSQVTVYIDNFIYSVFLVHEYLSVI